MEAENEMLAEVKIVAHISVEEPITIYKWFGFASEKQKPYSLLEAIGSFYKLKRVMAQILRAVFNFKQIAYLKSKKENRKIGPLSNKEMSEATFVLVHIDLKSTFQKEFKSLSKQGATNGTVWFDEKKKVLRLNGRVLSENLTFDEQFSILLSPNGELAALIIRAAHWMGACNKYCKLFANNFGLIKLECWPEK